MRYSDQWDLLEKTIVGTVFLPIIANRRGFFFVLRVALFLLPKLSGSLLQNYVTTITWQFLEEKKEILDKGAQVLLEKEKTEGK